MRILGAPKKALVLSLLLLPTYTYADNWDQVEKVIESAKGVGAKPGPGEFVGYPDAFLGKAIVVTEKGLRVYLRSGHQNSKLLKSLAMRCQDSIRDQPFWLLYPEGARNTFTCESIETKPHGEQQEYFVWLKSIDGRTVEKVAANSWVIFSFKQLVDQTWHKRAPTESELKIARSFQVKHVGKSYSSQYYKFDPQVQLIETKVGRFLLLPLIDLESEFVVPVGLILRETSANKWKEYAVLTSMAQPILDLDSDGFPEFFGGDDYDHGLWKLYPNSEILLKGGL